MKTNHIIKDNTSQRILTW